MNINLANVVCLKSELATQTVDVVDVTGGFRGGFELLFEKTVRGYAKVEIVAPYEEMETIFDEVEYAADPDGLIFCGNRVCVGGGAWTHSYQVVWPERVFHCMECAGNWVQTLDMDVELDLSVYKPRGTTQWFRTPYHPVTPGNTESVLRQWTGQGFLDEPGPNYMDYYVSIGGDATEPRTCGATGGTDSDSN